MYQHERRKKILDIIRKQGDINIIRDTKKLAISSATMHRDLAYLEKEGQLKKIRGGAVITDGPYIPSRFDIRMKRNVDEKESIARNAVKTIRDDTSIFLDHSSTTYYLAQEIKKNRFKNLIIITNSLIIPLELSEKPGIKIIMPGGVVEGEYKALSGKLLIESIKQFNLHQVFVSVAAASPQKGLMTQATFIHELLPELFRETSKINVLIDSSKFFQIAAFKISALTASMHLFSDSGLSQNLRNEVLTSGSQLTI